MKIAIVASTAWYVWNFRRNLLVALREAGHEIVAVAGDDKYGDQLREAGFTFRSVPFNGSGVNPWREASTVLTLRRVLAEEAVDVALTYTPKGNIYTAFALVHRPGKLIATISGLGYAFVSSAWLARVATVMYRLALRRVAHVFFENSDDLTLFKQLSLVRPDRAGLLPGAGVDLTHFAAVEANPPSTAGSVRFLMVARLLWEKGVGEYVAAARAVKRQFPGASFGLLGPMDASSKRGVPQETLSGWVREGLLDYLGATDDVRPHVAAADCVVLPSYREGMPRSLLEAAAMTRPVITTDTPGCRDCVVPGVSGYLCHPRDGQDLAQQMLTFVALPYDAQRAMGRAARARVEAKFDERAVIRQYLAAIEALTPRLPSTEPA